MNAWLNDWDFLAHGLTLHMVDIYSRTPRTLQLENIAAGDGQVLASHRYGSKPLVLEGTIKADTMPELEALIDTVIQRFSDVGGVLDIEHAGGLRRFIVTSSNIAITRPRYGATIAEFSIEFVVPSGYGSDTTSMLLLEEVVTTSGASFALDIGGSFYSRPDVTVALTGLDTGGIDKAVRLTNPTNNTGLALPYNYVDGDTIILTGDNQEARVGGVSLFGTGVYPLWNPGPGSFEYADDFVDRTATITMTYTRRWG